MKKAEVLDVVATKLKEGDNRHEAWARVLEYVEKWRGDKNTVWSSEKVDEFRSDMIDVAAIAFQAVHPGWCVDIVKTQIAVQIEEFDDQWAGEHEYSPGEWVAVIGSYFDDYRGAGFGRAYRARMVKIAAKATEAVMSVDEMRMNGGRCFYEEVV
jgi:hypothetical protein